MSRRSLLYGVAAGAGVVALAGCSGGSPSREGGGSGGNGDREITDAEVGSETEPITPPGEYNEAPMLAELVEAGELDPVDERLPTNPYVPPHRWTTTGNYGGTMRMVMNDSDAGSMAELCYGHSFLRFLNDGLDIGPGLAESWEHDADQMVWTLHFREGLRWSDGAPWTTADIMFWWEDMVGNPDHPEVPPDDVRSGRDTVATVSAPDDYTLVLEFDAPAPITPERLAAWVNRGIGPQWMAPRHYAEQFHPDYSDEIDSSSNWATTLDDRLLWRSNPDCPTMTGWHVVEYREGRTVIYERNAYYYAVDRDGNQLPYIDRIHLRAVANETQLLQFLQGAADFALCANGHNEHITLAQVSELEDSEEDSELEVRFWDSGSGTGSITFWNYDHRDEKMRELIRTPEFRQALSHAIDREEIQRAVYFGTGERTTGTLSPKGVIFAADEEAEERYREWRDAYVEYDPDLAGSMLEELGVVDSNGDGMREFPDGSRLRLSIDFPAEPSEEYERVNNFVHQSWRDIGIDAHLNPVSPDGFGELWDRGDLTIRTAWEVGDNHPLIYPGWVIPVQNAHWAPLHGQAFILQTGDPERLEAQADRDPFDRQPPWMLPEEGDPIDQLWKLYQQARVETDEMERTRLLWEVVKVHVEHGPFLLGVVANYPRPVLVKHGLQNVPYQENLALGGWVNPWILPAPAVYDPETFFWDDPAAHE